MAVLHGLAFRSLCVAALSLTSCGRVGLELLPASSSELDASHNDSDTGIDASTAPGDDAAADSETPSDDAGTDGGSPPHDAGADSGSPPVDAGADSGSPPVDAGTDSGSPPVDAGSIPRGPRVVVDNGNGSARTDYPVRVSIDTATLISQGVLAPDCSTLRVFGGADCASARSFFLPQHSCNSAETELWVRVPALPDHGREVLRLAFDGGPGTGSRGSAVFKFFEDFDGNTLDRSRWSHFGSGTVNVSQGLLRSTGASILQSNNAQVGAGADVLGVRIAAAGEVNSDVELGVGTFTSPAATLDDLWAFSRSWQGITIVSYVSSTYAMRPPTGASCAGTSSNLPGIGAAWLDVVPTPASFLAAEFSYAVANNRTAATLVSPRAGTLQAQSDLGCTLPNQLPILIGLDHNRAGSALEQRLDYVYVRPASAPEPTTTVMLDAALNCGSQ